MNNKFIIAVDAMGGEGSPKKVLDGISIFCEKNNDIFFKIFGDKNLIEKNISKKVNKDRYDIIHTDDFVKDEDSAFMGAKNKKTSMWLAVESVKNKESDIFC